MLSLTGIFIQLLITSSFAEESVTPEPPEDAIIPENTRPGEFPFITPLLVEFPPGSGKLITFCAGSLITWKHILTAAHCTENFNATTVSMLRVAVGVYNVSDIPPANIFRVVKFWMHEDYDPEKILNDIAVLTLENEIPQSLRNSVKKIYVAGADDHDPGVHLWAAGWGVSNIKNRAISPLPLKAIIPPMKLDECQRRLGRTILKSQICLQTKGQSLCQGDSGGPVFQFNKYRIPFLIGVTSFTQKGCIPGTINVLTRAYTYLDWIKQHVSMQANLS